jgi:anti-anti-sigma factor
MREPAERSATQIVAFPVEVDLCNAPYAATWLLETLEKRPRVVIADMSVTKFCDTSGIRILLLANRRMAEQGTELRIVLPSPVVRRTIHVADVKNVLRLYPDLAAAQAGQPASPVQGQPVQAFVPRQRCSP